MEFERNREKNELWSIIKWSLIIFVILFISLTALGITPIGVIELNNFFFSLFIHEEEVQPISSETNQLTPVEESLQEIVTPVAVNNSITALPVRIVIRAISVEARVLNPISRDIPVLDNALLLGAVRYPGSGDLESKRNIFIFGHSSGLPVVHNQSFKVFNRLKELAIGDEIHLQSQNRESVYKVSSVALSTADQAFVDFTRDEHKLILSTCNTFGAKQERFIVTAEFVKSYPLEN